MNCKMFKNWDKRNKSYVGYVGSSVAVVANSSSDTPDTWTWKGQLCIVHGVTLFLEQHLTYNQINHGVCLGTQTQFFFYLQRVCVNGWRGAVVWLVMRRSWVRAPSKAPRCFLEQETLPLLLSTGWFQERIRACFHNRTKIIWGPYGRLT